MAAYIELKELNAPLNQGLQSSSKLKVESPDTPELSGKINSIRLCVAPTWKKVLRYICYILTGFIMYLLATWFRKLYVMLTFVDSTEEEADWVIIYGGSKNIEISPLIRSRVSSKLVKAFYYRLFKYYYDEASSIWRPAQFNLGTKTCKQIHQEYESGLDETQLNDNTMFFDKNNTDIPKKSWVTLLFEEVLSPFYIFQIYSFIIWYLDNYLAFALVIAFFSLVSITLALIETIQTTSRLREMSYYVIQVNVIRRVNGEQKKFTISSTELVPGDLLEIPENVYMPCDAILLNGTCIMNEAMLTGESIPVVKSSLPQSDNKIVPSEEKQYTLYAGTMCIQARYTKGNAVLGLVTLTGFTTMKGELIRTMLFPKPTDFKFYADSFKFIFVLACMAVGGFLIDLPSLLEIAEQDENGEVIQLIIIKACELVTITVPPALPTCMQIGISVALARLKKKQIYCISPNKINEAGQVNVMCFDKTGTLTEDGLDLLGVRPVFYDKNKNDLSFAKLTNDMAKLTPMIDPALRITELQNYVNTENGLPPKMSIYNSRMFPCEHLLEIMATCHSLTYVNNAMIGDPLDIKMFEATKWSLEENVNQKFGSTVTARVRSPVPQTRARADSLTDSNMNELVNRKDIGIIRKFEFSSKLQRMSVVVQDLLEEETFKIHIKGSPEKIRELCRKESVPENFHIVLEKYTEQGYRVLACASRIVHSNLQTIMSAKRESLEKDFNLIGFLIMENRLKPITTQVIDTLQAAEIRTIMVTGDNVLTAISVARQCHIVAPNQRIFLGDLSEGKNGKSKIAWKDFEFSENKLNADLEPEIDYEQRIPHKIKRGSRQNSRVELSRQNSRKTRKLKHMRTGSFNDAVEQSPLTPHLNLSSIKEIQADNPDEVVQEVAEIDTPPDTEEYHQLIDFDPPFFDLQDTEDYCIAVTGKVFSRILYEVEVKNNPKYAHTLRKLLKKCLVFARMQPDEKALMIKHMMSIPKNKVGMCGDGANDVGALKTANMGVSLSEAEASIAAPFTSKIQDISCILKLLREGRSALSTSYQAFKYMALYSMIQFTSVTILYYNLNEFKNWHYYHFDLGIILLLSATMAMSGTAKKLTKYKPTGRLISVQILTSVVGMIVIQMCFQVYTYTLLQQQEWFVPNEEGFAKKVPTAENTTIYFVSMYQYCMVALAFIVGKPFRKPFYTNGWFTISLILILIVNLLITYNPFDWQILYDEDMGCQIRAPMDWRNNIVIIVFVNMIVTLFWEKIVVKQVSIRWKKYLDSKEALREAEENVFRPDKKQ